jgi:type VI secretion system (T6SS) effector TldE1-like protein
VPVAKRRLTSRCQSGSKIVDGTGSPLVYVGIAALAAGVALGIAAPLSIVWGPGTTQSEGLARQDALEPPDPDRLEIRVDASTDRVDSISERATSAIEPHGRSFAARFADAFDWSGSRRTAVKEDRADSVAPSAPDPFGQPANPHAVEHSAGGTGTRASPPPNASKKQARIADPVEDSISPTEADNRTAIYDIAARMVYLPNGQRLEAHSGLGSHLDDPGSVNLKDRGATPPNVYSLTSREELFHGVHAIRLIPVGGGNMFGRDGMLAHSYMLGPNGQSNGCVSFKDYPRFLNAFMSGEVNRLVVVKHLANAPRSQTAEAGWLPATIKALFGRS